MYYVFFETGNKVFFSRIADAFCSVVVQSIFEMVKDTLSDVSATDANLEKNVLRPLNCVLFPSVCCGNQECGANTIAVLTSDQLDRFEISMTHTNTAFLRANTVLNNPKGRINFQRILQNYRIMNIQGVEQIHIENKGNDAEYLRSYIKKTDKLKGKADGFVYVRAETDSDYDYFKTHTGLPNVTACDCFQHLEV